MFRTLYISLVALLTLHPAARATDDPFTSVAYHDLLEAARHSAHLQSTLSHLSERGTLGEQLYREGEKLAAQDFSRAAPYYAASLAVLKAAFAHQSDSPPAEATDQALNQTWDRVTNVTQALALTTAKDQTYYQEADLHAAFTRGELAKTYQGYEQQFFAFKQSVVEAVNDFRRRHTVIREALEREMLEIAKKRNRITAGVEEVKRVDAEIKSRRSALDTEKEDYDRDVEKLNRDIHRYEKMAASEQKDNVYDDLRHRELNLNEDKNIFLSHVAAWESTVARHNADIEAIRTDDAETSARERKRDGAVRVLRDAEQLANQH